MNRELLYKFYMEIISQLSNAEILVLANDLIEYVNEDETW